MSSDLRTLPKLKPAIKKRWLKALRSGEYKQTTEVLRSTDAAGVPIGYCCLGVLADVVRKDKALQLEWTRNGREGSKIDDSATAFGDNILAYIVAEPDVVADADFSSLVRRNDGGINDRTGEAFTPQNFRQIANLIETHC